MLLAASLSAEERDLVRRADLERLLRGALADLGQLAASVNCRLTVPGEVRLLNRKFAGSDHETDVLAFPAAGTEEFRLPAAEAGLVGDLVISVTTAALQARQAGVEPEGELRLLAVHGLLHLLGHDHGAAADAEAMTRATRRLLARAARRRGLPPPSVPRLRPGP